MTFDKLLRYAVLSGIFAIPFIPLIVSNNLFFPFITGKNFTFRIVVELMTAAWLLLLIKDSAYRPRLSPIVWAFLAFLATIGISTLLSENPYKSFWSNFERMEGYVTLLHLFFYFLIFTVFLKSEKDWRDWFKVSTFVSAILCGFGAFQLAGALTINQGAVRVDATLGNATYLAAYLLFHIFFIAWLWFRERDLPWTILEKSGLWALSALGLVTLLVADFGNVQLFFREGALWTNLFLLLPIVTAAALPYFRKDWFFASLILFEVFILYHTATRGALLGLLGGVFLTALSLALFERKNLLLKKVSIGVLVFVLATVAAFFAFKNTSLVRESPVLSRFANISLEEQTTKSRFLIWNMAFRGFSERPVFGWGQENFNYIFNKYYSPEMYQQEQWFDRTHNVLLDWLVAGGLLGLLAYLSFFAIALYLLWTRAGFPFTERALLTGLISAYFFHNIFVFDNLVSYLFWFALLAYIHARSVESSPRPPYPPMLKDKVAIPVVTILLLSVFYLVNARPIISNSLLIKAISPHSDSPTSNLEFFKKALAYESFGDQEIREQLIQGSSSLKNANISFDLKNTFFELATSEMRKMMEEAPGDTRHPFFLGGLLNSYGLYTEAVPYLERALATSPNKHAIKFELGASYLGLKKYEAALQVLKGAYESEPKFDEARIIYAVGAIYAGRSSLARELLEARYGSLSKVTDERVARAYRDAGEFDLMLGILKARADISADSNTLLTLAAGYLQAGRRGDAISTLGKIGETYPQFKAETDKYIEEIKAGKSFE